MEEAPYFLMECFTAIMKSRSLVLASFGLIVWMSACTSVPQVAPSLPPLASPVPASSPPPQALPTPAVSPTPTPAGAEAWYQPLDPSYAALKYSYALVTNPEARMYLSLEGAQSASLINKRLPQANDYVSYTRTVVQSGRTYYQLASGDWMRGQDLEEITPSSFSGIRLSAPLTVRFGWVLEAIDSAQAGGSPRRSYSRYQVIREDASVPPQAGFMAVAPGEYLPLKSLSLVTPGFRPPLGVNPCRFVLVDLAEQNLSVYDGCQLVFATLISSGREFGSTPLGTFTVFKKSEYDLVTPPFQGGDQYYLDNVPFIDFFYGVWALHAAYWHDQFGFPVSHGCINLAPADARWIYDWIAVGDRVIVLPPTG